MQDAGRAGMELSPRRRGELAGLEDFAAPAAGQPRPLSGARLGRSCPEGLQTPFFTELS